MLLLKVFPLAGITLLLLLSVSCTSLGHVSRARPQVAKHADKFSEIGFDGDDNALAVGMEKLLDSHGIKVKIISSPKVREIVANKEYEYDEIQTRYVIKVSSQDLDTCVPEGSRQMHFAVSVIDYKERNRIFLMSGQYGCMDTLLKNFEEWMSTNIK